MQFRKDSGPTEASCTLSVFDDGSAHVLGETIEWIFEGKPDAWLEAIACLQNVGYRQIDGDSSA